MLRSRCIYSNYIPSVLEKIRTVVDELIISLQNDCGEMYDENIFDLRVILNEVLVNAILHGNHGDASKKVKIDAGITDNDEFFLIIEDEGCGYNFTEVCNRHKTSITDLDLMNESGRGIMLVKGLCDKVKVNKKGNKIVVMKKIEKIRSFQ